jgi:uncharacterized protein (DUF1697 family)
MMQYVAFLRGINVGGHNLLKMEDLRQRFTSLGFNNVSSYKQSGNIIFETSAIDSNVISKGIQRELYELLGGNIKVFLRTMPQVEEIVQLNPFKEIKSRTTKLFVTFLSDEPSIKPAIPLKSPSMDVEVILIRNREAFSLARSKKGRFGTPNSFIETKLGVSATTRSWATVKGIAAT